MRDSRRNCAHNGRDQALAILPYRNKCTTRLPHHRTLPTASLLVSRLLLLSFCQYFTRYATSSRRALFQKGTRLKSLTVPDMQCYACSFAGGSTPEQMLLVGSFARVFKLSTATVAVATPFALISKVSKSNSSYLHPSFVRHGQRQRKIRAPIE